MAEGRESAEGAFFVLRVGWRSRSLAFGLGVRIGISELTAFLASCAGNFFGFWACMVDGRHLANLESHEPNRLQHCRGLIKGA